MTSVGPAEGEMAGGCLIALFDLIAEIIRLVIRLLKAEPEFQSICEVKDDN